MAFLAIVFILVCILMIGIILLQKGRGGGLSNAFGGGGGHSAFGIRTGDTLTWITVGLVGLFFLLGAIAVKVMVPDLKMEPGESTELTVPATEDTATSETEAVEESAEAVEATQPQADASAEEVVDTVEASEEKTE